MWVIVGTHTLVDFLSKGRKTASPGVPCCGTCEDMQPWEVRGDKAPGWLAPELDLPECCDTICRTAGRAANSTNIPRRYRRQARELRGESYTRTPYTAHVEPEQKM